MARTACELELLSEAGSTRDKPEICTQKKIDCCELRRLLQRQNLHFEGHVDAFAEDMSASRGVDFSSKIFQANWALHGVIERL